MLCPPLSPELEQKQRRDESALLQLSREGLIYLTSDIENEDVPWKHPYRVVRCSVEIDDPAQPEVVSVG